MLVLASFRIRILLHQPPLGVFLFCANKPAEGVLALFPSSSLISEDTTDRATPELEFHALGPTVLI